MTTYATPLCGATLAKKSFSALMPPAEAPMPTTRSLPAGSSGWWRSAANSSAILDPCAAYYRGRLGGVTNQIVVIGASAGGLEALRTLVHQLPAEFPVPICIVLHA